VYLSLAGLAIADAGKYVSMFLDQLDGDDIEVRRRSIKLLTMLLMHRADKV
jgi:hypothetical protein